MMKKVNRKKKTTSVKKEGQPFEQVVMGLHGEIEKRRGKTDARHYLKWANGILVFFPKELRNTVVEGYGRVIAFRGSSLADHYLDHLKELFRLEKESESKKGFPLTERAAKEGAEVLTLESVGAAQKFLHRLMPSKSQQDADDLFVSIRNLV